jgi:hypothetical protein
LEIAQMRSLLQLMQERGLRRIFVIESEYALAMREAELVWTRNLVEEISSGKLGDLEEWAAMQRALDQQGREASMVEEAEDKEG